ncbi:hypothetical protein [Pandoraea terrae]|nr:hypothetical protein [Pandoraea terrae]
MKTDAAEETPAMHLAVAMDRYAHTQPLFDGTIRMPGLALERVEVPLGQVFKRFWQDAPWPVVEMSLGKFVALLSRQTLDCIALPIFPYRVFRHGAWYVLHDNPLTPTQLRGKRVGLSDWPLTAAIYARALLTQQYGVALEDIHWVEAGLEAPSRITAEPTAVDGMDITRVADRSLVDLLRTGDLDAIIAPHLSAVSSEGLRHLLPDHARDARRDWRATGVFPIMHVMLLRGDVERDRPGTAAQLMAGFHAAKVHCMAEFDAAGATPYPLPLLDAHLADLRAIMGHDVWPYGVEPNRVTLDAFLNFAHAQGVTPYRMSIEEVFPLACEPAPPAGNSTAN